MNLGSVIQSEVSQKEKNKYLILIHIYGIQKNDTDKPICREGIETQVSSMDVWIQWGRSRTNWETSIDIYTMEYYSTIKKEHIWVSSNEVDEPRDYYSEWSKSEREKQISYINTHTWKLERWYWWTYLQGSNGDADIKNRLMNTGGVAGRKEWVRWMERVAWNHKYYHM